MKGVGHWINDVLNLKERNPEHTIPVLYASRVTLFAVDSEG